MHFMYGAFFVQGDRVLFICEGQRDPHARLRAVGAVCARVCARDACA